jgi:hypothetical protein
MFRRISPSPIVKAQALAPPREDTFVEVQRFNREKRWEVLCKLHEYGDGKYLWRKIGSEQSRDYKRVRAKSAPRLRGASDYVSICVYVGVCWGILCASFSLCWGLEVCQARPCLGVSRFVWAFLYATQHNPCISIRARSLVRLSLSPLRSWPVLLAIFCLLKLAGPEMLAPVAPVNAGACRSCQCWRLSLLSTVVPSATCCECF